jgi:hypothetical protein
MSYITWNTKSGSLGAIAQSQYYEFPLSAADSAGMPLQFTHIAGTMPIGMGVDSHTGIVKGVPVIQATGLSKTVAYMFTIRASNATGVVADRSFTITVNNFSSVKINIDNGILGTYDDGKLLSYQFTALSDNPAPLLTWSIVNGELPIDIITGKPIVLDATGLLHGHISRLVDSTGVPTGYDETNADTFPYDFPAEGQDRSYTFTLMVTDGANFDTASIRINVVAKGHLTADNAITLVNNTFLTVDTDASYPPVVITDPSTIPVLTVGDNFTFKFDAINLNVDTPYYQYGPIEWGNDAAISLAGMSISNVTGWLSGTVPQQTEAQTSHNFIVYATQPQIDVHYGNVRVLKSLEIPVTITTVKDSSNYITWTTPAMLGTMVNGTISEYKITAVNNAKKDLTYSLLPRYAVTFNDTTIKLDAGDVFAAIAIVRERLQISQSVPDSAFTITPIAANMPSNLTLMPNGEIAGRCGFEYFSIDNHSANITVDNISGITTGMNVTGPGVASGCHVVGVYGQNTVKIQPSVFITEGAEINFIDLSTNVSVTKALTSLSTTTLIDGGKTMFDNSYHFTVKATALDKSVSDTKVFTITKDNYNRAPYVDVWLRALLLKEQRDLYYSIISNADIFPPELIYRKDDPNFGIADTLKMLFAPGLITSELSVYASAAMLNHYNKSIKFGNIKTARALDDKFNVQYEVVYIDVIDDKESKGKSAGLLQEPGVNPFLYNRYPDDNNSYAYVADEFRTLYPNSYSNMRYRLSSGVGYANRGALPRWMTSRQEDGKELGLVRAIVLAYTVPGASKLIAYRLKDSGIVFSDIHFVTDRYYVGTSISANYDPVINDFFVPNADTDLTDKYIHYQQYGVYR